MNEHTGNSDERRWRGRAAGIAIGIGLGLLSSCNRSRQDEWDVPPSTAARRPGLASAASEPHADPVAQGLFARNCAACHGLDGSGQGPSVLDRPARNFKDGGFSFGNTAEAIFNTISHGIPGTPMPAFDALSEHERRVLADYVRTLGPPVDDVDEAETILTVTAESGPRIVRGILPPIVEGAPIRPRGMLVGLPGDAGDGEDGGAGTGGLTFEYRIDDVRLLGVRQGGFVARTDWGGRGGTPLKPLGGLIWVNGDGDPEAMFTGTTGFHATRQLVSTFGNEVRSQLVSDDSVILASFEEQVYESRRGPLNGFATSTEVKMFLQDFRWTLLIIVGVPEESRHVATVGPSPSSQSDAEEPVIEWQVFQRPDGVYEYVGTLLADGSLDRAPTLSGSSLIASRTVNRMDTLDLPVKFRFVVHRLFSTEWSDSIRESLVDGAR